MPLYVRTSFRGGGVYFVAGSANIKSYQLPVTGSRSLKRYWQPGTGNRPLSFYFVEFGVDQLLDRRHEVRVPAL